MAKNSEKLVSEQRQCETKPAGSYTIAPNLILRVKATPTGTTRSWVFRYKDKASQKIIERGLGPLYKRNHASAVAMAAKMHELITDGIDLRQALETKKVSTVKTFRMFAADFIKVRGTEFRNGKHLAQWPSTLNDYVYPHIGDKSPADISYDDIEKILYQDSLITKIETRSRVKQRIANILTYAAMKEGQPHRFNPAVQLKLAKRKKSRVKRHAAVPWQQLPAIMAGLRLKDAASAAVVRWVVLTAARSGEARGATWGEIAAWEGVWTVPASRMKMEVEHRVPLSVEARAIIATQATKRRQPHNDAQLVFPGPTGGMLSDVAISKMLHGFAPGFTIHGMRSAFRQWGADNGVNREALELALAHSNPNATEEAYQRSDLFDLRVTIMQSWADFLSKDN